VLLAVELPEPFLVPTIIEKSFTTLFILLLIVDVLAPPDFGGVASLGKAIPFLWNHC
jgi:hypothetical protein